MNEEALGRCIERLGTVFKELGEVFLGFSESISQQHSSQTPHEQPPAANVQSRSTETPQKTTPTIQKAATSAQSVQKQQANTSFVAKEQVVTSPQQERAIASPTKFVQQTTPVMQRKESSSQEAAVTNKATEQGPSSASDPTATPVKDMQHTDHENIESTKKSDKKKKKKDKHLDSHRKHSESKEKHKKDSKKKKHKHSSEKKKRKHDSEERVMESEASDDNDSDASLPSHQLAAVSSSQKNIDSIQQLQQGQGQSSSKHVASLEQNGQEAVQKNKRPRQNWNKEDDKLFLESISKAIEANPQLTEREVIVQLEHDFAGKRKREQLRKHYQSFQKSGKLPPGAPTRSDE
ncbi:hypothetical protein GpartN1_g604.t1 [Galdieria partita]|uniref:Uncharacterized protein n=1 Tax=Galdieria partita TaxID=83374 RepID=A0A9C7UMN8_9RHOD|nr:hypothetical protein GpartN1_g604.t1 [Galdieria partita]